MATRAPCSEGPQIGEELVRRRWVDSQGKDGGYEYRYLPRKPRPWRYGCPWASFPIVESQHKTEEGNAKARNLVALAMLTVDSVLKVEQVIGTSKRGPK